MSKRQKSTPNISRKMFGTGRRTKQTANRVLEEEAEQVPQYDRTRFTTIENEVWCREREQANAHILVERNVTSTVEDVYQLREQLQKLGWEGMLDLPDVYYPDLVREFYANIPDKKAKRTRLDELTTWVRGVEIPLTDETICELVKAPTQGEQVDLMKSFTPPSTWKISEAAVRLGVQWTKRGNQDKHQLKTSLFTPVNRLLINLFGSNIIPKVSGTDEARTSDVYFLDQIFRNVGRRRACILGDIIIKHMWTVARSKPSHALPYARLLTLVFHFHGVELEGIPFIRVKPNEAVGSETCRKLKCPLEVRQEIETGQASGTQAEGEAEQAQEEAHGGASTSYMPPPRDSRHGWQRVLDRINVFEDRMTQRMDRQEMHLQSLDARVHWIEGRLGRAGPSTSYAPEDTTFDPPPP